MAPAHHPARAGLLLAALLLLSAASARDLLQADDPAAGGMGADDDAEPKLGLRQADAADDAASLELSKADLRALGVAGADPLRNIGLSPAELAELKKLEADTAAEGGPPYAGKKDKRATEAAPPPGMVAAGDPNAPPPKPHQPAERPPADRQAADGAAPPPPADDPVARADREARQATKAAAEAQDRAERTKLLARIAALTKDLDGARGDARGAKEELARAQGNYEKAIDAERQEHKIEKEELAAAIEERKRAFDELYEEKQVLGQILSEEQKTLHELQDKIQHPDLGLWIRQRAERAAILVETPETDAMKFYARKYMAPKVTKMRHKLELLEKRVEKSVDHLLPAKYGSVVALLLCVGLIGFPMFVTFTTVWSVTKSVSLRQYVLLGNVFLTAFSSGLCIAGLLLQQDPLQTLYEASESMFIILQLAAAVVFPVFVGVIFCAVLKSRDQEDLFVFGCELVFYVLVGLNYRARVWRPAMLGENIETSRMMYVVYVIDFLSMTALTISSAKMDRARAAMLVGDGNGYVPADVEDPAGQPGKVTTVTGSASLASTRSGLGALGSGLMKAARGASDGGGKEE